MPLTFETTYFDDPPNPQRALEIFVPETATPRPVAVYFVHGGGWLGGSRTGCHTLVWHLLQDGYVCASVDYRLKGVTAWDQVDDIRQGQRLLEQRLRSRGLPTQFVMHGGSAGAHLVLLDALSRPADLDITLPVGLSVTSAAVTFEPWPDIFPHVWENMQIIAGKPFAEDPQRYRELSPIHHVSDRSPATFFLDAGNEHMFPHDLNEAFAEKMRQHGRPVERKVYANGEHGFFYSVERNVQKQAMADWRRFLDDCCKRAAQSATSTPSSTGCQHS